MPSPTSTLSITTVKQLSGAARLNVAGLSLAAVGMLLQIVAGSTLYPTVSGPIVLIVTAAIVAFWPGRWPTYVGLLVPLVLGLGAIAVAAMTGQLIDQLTNVGAIGVFLGSVMHVVGLAAAVAGGVRIVMDGRARGHGGR